MTDVLKVISVLIPCALFGKVGMLSAVAAFKFNFWKIMLVTNAGGIGGTILFTYVSAALLKWWDKLKFKYFRTHKHPKVFTRTNRMVIKAKRRFGLYGVAFLTPILLSFPFGAFIAERFYKDKRKVILALSLAVIFWNLALYFLFYFFWGITKYI
jgi:hypothetical protein